MSTKPTRRPHNGAQWMIHTATFAGRLLAKAELWDKVRACARLGPDGKWVVNVDSPHRDDQLSERFDREVGAGASYEVATAIWPSASSCGVNDEFDPCTGRPGADSSSSDVTGGGR